MHNIGIIGKARSGKDTAALYLVRTLSYSRLAFADPLKEMALSIDPVVPTTTGVHVRLSTLIRDVGWEYAKDTYPEVRRILQYTGQTVRDYDDEFWLTAMRRKLNNAEAWNLPVVVTDVRYPNEANMLRARGFKLVRIVRPVPTKLPITGDRPTPARFLDAAATHSSETAMDNYEADATIYNSATPADLGKRLAAEL
jgi:hypothetical protein